MSKKWEVKTIGEMCDLMTGGTPSRVRPEYFEGGKIKWLVSGDIHKGEIYDCEGRITKGGFDNSNARFLPINSILIALNGQGKTRGTVAILRTKATCNQSLVSIYPKDTDYLLPEYLHRVLSGRYEEIRKMTGDSGNDRRGLNMPLIRSIKIVVPPLSEQKRIVGILDEKFDAIEKFKNVTEEQIKDAKELTRNTKNEIFNKSKKGWEVKNLSEICSIARGGSPRPISAFLTDDEDGVNWIKIGDVAEGSKFITSTKQKIKKEGETRSRKVFPGNFLLSNSMSFGRPYILKIEGCIHDGWLVLKLDEAVIKPDYLYQFLSSQEAYNQLDRMAQGSTVRNINIDIASKLQVLLPSDPEEQGRIAKQLDLLSQRTKSLEEVFYQKLDGLEELKKSYLEQAFAGKL